MTDYYQGPGRNIDFCLITSGIDIDPDHGGIAKAFYNWIKEVIQERAELHYENRNLREVFDTDVSSFLEGYTSDPRHATQFLYGIVEHSNPWNEDSIIAAIDGAEYPRKFYPNDGEYSIDFIKSQEDGMTLYANEVISSTDVWLEQQTTYYSNLFPQMLDGSAGDVWIISDDDGFDIWIKPAFSWMRLTDYVKTTTPTGTFTISTVDPGNSTNSWWLDLTGLNIRKYSEQINSWESAPTTTVSQTQPVGPSVGDLWVKEERGRFVLYVFDGLYSAFIRAKVSKFPVLDRTTNSAFNGQTGQNNFTIVCGQDALLGAPITGGAGNLKIKKDGVLIQTAVETIDFLGPDIEVIATGAGAASVEHLPYTTLPELGSAPAAVADSGRIFTLEIGGITELFYRDDTGDIIQLTNNGVTPQNIYLAVATASAVAGQTVFSIPGTAKAVLTVKVNGVDTTAWTYTSPSVTYIPALGGYTIQSGDVVSVLYYGQ